MCGAIAAEWVFVRFSHALEIPVGTGVDQATVTAQHHGVLVIALMLGAVVAMCGTFAASMFDTTGQRSLSLALIPIPLTCGLALGLALAPYRIASFAAIVAVLTVGALVRRFGPRGFFGGVFLFLGTFFGNFLSSAVTFSAAALGWLLAEACVAVAVLVLLQSTVFRPRDDLTLGRLRRSFGARARSVTATALELARTDPANRRERDRLVRLLRRRTLWFNETALMVDAYLARPGALPDGADPEFLHQRLFDLELAVTSLARFTVALTAADLPPGGSALISSGLAAVGRLDPDAAQTVGTAVLETFLPQSGAAGEPPEAAVRIVGHRFGDCLIIFARALTDLRDGGLGERAPGDRSAAPSFTAAAGLVGGWLPTSATVSKTASEDNGRGRGIAPTNRVAVQICVAVTLAMVLGDQLDQKRWYWAVMAAFVTFLGANNAGEQLRKGWLRVVGTVAGVLVGALLAHVVGRHVFLALVVIMVAMFLGIYFMRSNYALFTVAVTIAVSQLYTELGTYSDGLLLLRLEETALGVAVTVVVVLVVLPLRTGRVVRVATAEYLDALIDLLRAAEAALLGGGTADRPGDCDAPRDLGDSDIPGDGDADHREHRAGPEDAVGLRSAARRVDAAFQTFATTMTARGLPLLPTPSSRALFANSLAASRVYARQLTADAATPIALDPARSQHLRFAVDTLCSSVQALTERVRGRTGDEYVRTASVLDALRAGSGMAETDPGALALRDLQFVDGALAVVAEQFGLRVSGLDEIDAGAHRSGTPVLPR